MPQARKSAKNSKNQLVFTVQNPPRASNKKKSGGGNKMVNKGGLDGPALAWAKLLSDPCFAPVTHPIYPGGDGGLLARFESEFTVGTNLNNTALIVGYVPGALSNAVYLAEGLGDTTALTLSAFPTFSPGITFLQSAASAVRCVSACLQVSWPGSELSRQGYVALGQTTGSVVHQAITTATSVSALRPLCHLRTRVPETVAEVIWRPTLGDAEWNDPSLTTPVQDFGKKGAMLLAAGNLPNGTTANTGLRVRLVVTYEWQPKTNNGLASAYDARAKSRSSLDDVQNYLDQHGPDIMYRVGRATTTMAGMTGAYFVGRQGGQNARIRMP